MSYKYKAGDFVLWTDPEPGCCSQLITIKSIECTGDHIYLTSEDGSCLTCFDTELRLIENTMWILEFEMPGDGGDFYQRPTEVIAISEDKEKLEAIWTNLPISEKKEDDQPLREYNEFLYIDYNIYRVEVI